MSQRVIHFEISAEQPERALAFYTDVFGWTAHKWEGESDYWLLSTGEEGTAGINGAIARSCSEGMPVGVVNTIAVPSVDAFTEKVTAHGGKIIVPKMEIPGVGFLAYCQDTEGVPFGIIEMPAGG